MKRIYVGNLPLRASEEDIKAKFETFGTVSNVRIVTDKNTGKSRGFGFIEMETGADRAIHTLHESDFEGKTLNISEARRRIN